MHTKTLLELVFTVLFVFLFSITASASKVLELTYRVKTTRVNEEKKKADTTQETVVIYLGYEKIVVSKKDLKTVYDFRKATITSINISNKNYSIISLYSVPVFRVREKNNRERMGKFLSRIKKKSEIRALTSFELEMLFGITFNTSTHNKLLNRRKGSTQSFIHKNEEVASFTTSNKPLPNSYENLYRKFILYEHRMHPKIREEILKTGKIFKSLKYRYLPILKRKVHKEYTLIKSRIVESGEFSIPPGFMEVYSQNKRLSKIIALSLKGSNRLRPNDFKKMIEESIKRKDFLSAYLVSGEYLLQYGVKPIQEFRQIFQLAPYNSDARKLAYFMRPKSKSGLKQSVSFMESLLEKKPQRAHVIKVWLSNHYASLGNHKKSRELMLEALEANPFLTGAYKDLGTKFYNFYQMGEAWNCWNTAKKIAPNHPMLVPIKNLENALRRNHPEFF